MLGSQFSVPVLLLVFNRPETTRAVLESIKPIKPARVFVAADGPRAGVPADAARCKAAREIATAIDWRCELKTLYRDANLGCGHAVASALDWFFEGVPEGIVLEDDCVPSPSFFRFCEDLLQHYEDNARVMHISGHNFQYGRKRGDASYYFSQYAHGGGWATWRRAWERFDFNLIPEPDRKHVWDAAWHLSIQKNGGVAVLPNVNLVQNIGYGPDGTHTRTMTRAALLPAHEMPFPLKHPRRIAVDPAADRLTYYANFRNVPDLRFIWVFQLLDFVRLIPLRARKLLARLRGSKLPMHGASRHPR